MNIVKQYISLASCFILFIFFLSLSAITYARHAAGSNLQEGETAQFADVPADSYAGDAIHELRKAGIINGIGNNRFGYGKTLTRGEFITLLVKMAGWDMVLPETPSFDDNKNANKFYYAPVETALAHGVISINDGKVMPEDPVTGEEAIIMLIKSLGYGYLAERLDYLQNPNFANTNKPGYFSMAEDFGLISGISSFKPEEYILREQAAFMLAQARDILNKPLKRINAFYAIRSSPQQEKIPSLSSVCFGWSRLSFDPSSGEIVLNTSRNALGTNEYYLPEGFTKPLKSAKDAGIPALLGVYAAQDSKINDPSDGRQVGILEYVLTNPDVYRKVIKDIAKSVNSISRGGETGSFDGVAIDFEGLKGQKLKNHFSEFIKELGTKLKKDGKLLYVAVHPLIHPRRSPESMDGYDYRTIGQYADKVILMAHDYYAKRLTAQEMARGYNITPLTPIEDVYYALKAITDTGTGVSDRSKIMLQVSFDWIVWQRKDGKTLNDSPKSFNLENFMDLLKNQENIEFHYAREYANPYIKYTDTKTGNENTVWYENTLSVMEKIKLARYFGVQGISLWRLGTIPDYQPDGDVNNYGMDVWQNILKELDRNKDENTRQGNTDTP
ncbi:MAG: glycosyl hydrolase family 18 protein [Bacillota bacterium]